MSGFQPGRYRGKVIGGEAGESTKGSPSMNVQFSILTPEGQPSGHIKTVRFYLSGGAKPYSIPKLARLGFNSNFAAPEFDTETVFDLDMKLGNYNGKPREEWDLGFSRKAPAASALDALSAEYKAMVANMPQPVRPAQQIEAKPTTPPPPVPPPPSSGPPPVDESPKTATRAEAWDAFVKKFGEDAAKQWSSTIKSHTRETGLAEAAYTGADWAWMIGTLDIPF